MLIVFSWNSMKGLEISNPKKLSSVFSRHHSIQTSRLHQLRSLIELQEDLKMKAIFQDVALQIFYSKYLPKEEYPNVISFAQKMISLFGSTYLCEQLFCRMKYTKSSHRSRITDEHLENCLRMATTNIVPNICRLVKEKQSHAFSL